MLTLDGVSNIYWVCGRQSRGFPYFKGTKNSSSSVLIQFNVIILELARRLDEGAGHTKQRLNEFHF